MSMESTAAQKLEAENKPAVEAIPDSGERLKPLGPVLEVFKDGDKGKIDKVFDAETERFRQAIDAGSSDAPEMLRSPDVAVKVEASKQEALREAEAARANADAQIASVLGEKAPEPAQFDKFEYSKMIADKLVAEEQQQKKKEARFAALSDFAEGLAAEEAKAKEQQQKAQAIEEQLKALAPLVEQAPQDETEKLGQVERPRGFVGYEEPAAEVESYIATPEDETTAKSVRPKTDGFVAPEKVAAPAVGERALPAVEIVTPVEEREDEEAEPEAEPEADPKIVDEMSDRLEDLKQKPEPERTEVDKEEVAHLSHQLEIEKKNQQKRWLALDLAKREEKLQEAEIKMQMLLTKADVEKEPVKQAQTAVDQARNPEEKKAAENVLRLAKVMTLTPEDQREMVRLNDERKSVRADVGETRKKLTEIGVALVSLDLLLNQSKNRLEARRQEAERKREQDERARPSQEEAELQDIADTPEILEKAHERERKEKRKELTELAYKSGKGVLKGTLIAGGMVAALGFFSVSKAFGYGEKFLGWMSKKLDYMFTHDFADKARDLWNYLTFANDKPEPPKKPPQPAD